MTSQARTLGELDVRRYPPVGVRDEIRRNVIQRLGRGEPLFPGIVGFDDSVVPEVTNAILARHDFILLGLRGQAKTRICRMLAELLDPEIPVIKGSPLREHPLRPISRESRERARVEGDGLEIAWLSREERYGEKLATPDVTMADLIGDVDPLKAAHEGLDLSSEKVIHYGIVPRMNRGIFAVNELPDLAPRIQVGLLNLLEERDIQIRGFPVRLPLDLLVVFTANPEDYTNRGSIITPLKDRIASQILTHYPRDLENARVISEGEAWTRRDDGLPEVVLPRFVSDILEEIAFAGRTSEYIDQASGVSARLPIAARELLVSQVERRLVRDRDASPVARLIDVGHLLPAITGKVELVYEGEQEGPVNVARHLIGKATGEVFDRHFPDVIREGSEGSEGSDCYKPILDWFASGNRLDLSDDMRDAEYRAQLEKVPGLRGLADQHLPTADGVDDRIPAMELVLEGLHVHSLLAKEDVDHRTSYTDMLGIMMQGLS